MNLQGISVDVVRNKYEYEKYVSKDYRDKYDWEAFKGSMPWIILDFSRTGEFYTAAQNKVTVQFTPAADFTNVGTAPDGEWELGSDKTKLTVDLSKISRLMLEANRNAGFAELPNEFTVTVTDINGNTYQDTFKEIDTTDRNELLKYIDRNLNENGETFIGHLAYANAAQQPRMKVVTELPKTQTDGILYLVLEEETEG